MVIKWKYRISDGEFLEGTHGDLQNDNPENEVVVVARHPNPRTEKWDGSKVVPKTQLEIEAHEDIVSSEAFEEDDVVQAIISVLTPAQQVAVKGEFASRRRGRL